MNNYAPGVAEALAAAPPPPTPASSAPPSPPAAHAFLEDGRRRKEIELAWPITYAGRDWRTVQIRRLQVRDVVAYIDKVRELQKTDENASLRYPMFVDETGVDLPEGLFELLDDDDMITLNEAAEDFLPRRFRMMMASTTPISEPLPASPSSAPLATSAASSATSSVGA